MMWRKLFLLSLILLFLPLISSQDISSTSFGNYKVGTEIELIQGCTNQTSSCNQCNITTIKYPNSTIFKSDQVMTKRIADFNYTLLASETNIVGEYEVIGICGAGTEVLIWSSAFTITFSGETLSTAGGIVSIVFVVAILFVFTMCLWGSIVIPWGHNTDPEQNIVSVNDLRFVKIFLIAITYVLLMFIFGVLKRITESFLVLEGASSIFNWLYWIMLSFLWPLIVLVFIFSFIVWVQNLTLKKKVRRGALVKG